MFTPAVWMLSQQMKSGELFDSWCTVGTVSLTPFKSIANSHSSRNTLGGEASTVPHVAGLTSVDGRFGFGDATDEGGLGPL